MYGHMEHIRVLLVEDERKIADTVSRGLQELGFAVTTAYDGEIGWRLYEGQPFDLVITDLNLPGISGYQLCRNIRSRNRHIPILMLTALGTTEDKLEGFEAGTDDYLVKPFEFRELVARMRALLKRSEPREEQRKLLTVADLEMNLDSKEVTRAGKPIRLTAKEFQLLEYFMRNRNRVLSRADIASRIWEIDFDTKTNVIDVYINFLRNKLDRDFEPKLIHTMVGMGYVMKEPPHTR